MAKAIVTTPSLVSITFAKQLGNLILLLAFGHIFICYHLIHFIMNIFVNCCLNMFKSLNKKSTTATARVTHPHSFFDVQYINHIIYDGTRSEELPYL